MSRMLDRAAARGLAGSVHWDRLKALAETALFALFAAYWVLFAVVGGFASDALVYRAGAAQLIGGDPWAATHNGWTYAAPPLAAVVFLPAAALPAPMFAIMFVAVSAAAGVVLVRRLRLPGRWIAFPPLVAGVVLGNPAVVALALIVVGRHTLGLVLRPQLLLAASPRAIVGFALLSGLALAFRPDYLASLGSVVGTYARETVVVNFWGSILMLPASIALLLLWRVDRAAASWLVMPAMGPAMGWYGYTMVMPVRSTALALACAVPVPGLGAAAITLYALVRWFRDRPR